MTTQRATKYSKLLEKFILFRMNWSSQKNSKFLQAKTLNPHSQSNLRTVRSQWSPMSSSQSKILQFLMSTQANSQFLTSKITNSARKTDKFYGKMSLISNISKILYRSLRVVRASGTTLLDKLSQDLNRKGRLRYTSFLVDISKTCSNNLKKKWFTRTRIWTR